VRSPELVPWEPPSRLDFYDLKLISLRKIIHQISRKRPIPLQVSSKQKIEREGIFFKLFGSRITDTSSFPNIKNHEQSLLSFAHPMLGLVELSPLRHGGCVATRRARIMRTLLFPTSSSKHKHVYDGGHDICLNVNDTKSGTFIF